MKKTEAEKKAAREAHAKERPPVLDMDQAADLLQISLTTLYRLLKDCAVPSRKIGREWRFGRDALIEWASGAAPTSTRKPAEAPASKWASKWDMEKLNILATDLCEDFVSLGSKLRPGVEPPSLEIIRQLLTSEGDGEASSAVHDFWEEENAEYWRDRIDFSGWLKKRKPTQ